MLQTMQQAAVHQHDLCRRGRRERQRSLIVGGMYQAASGYNTSGLRSGNDDRLSRQVLVTHTGLDGFRRRYFVQRFYGRHGRRLPRSHGVLRRHRRLPDCGWNSRCTDGRGCRRRHLRIQRLRRHDSDSSVTAASIQPPSNTATALTTTATALSTKTQRSMHRLGTRMPTATPTAMPPPPPSHAINPPATSVTTATATTATPTPIPLRMSTAAAATRTAMEPSTRTALSMH